MKWRIPEVLVCLALWVPTAMAVPLRVVSFNVGGDFVAETGIGDSTSSGNQAIRRILTRLDADVVVFQEIFNNDLEGAPDDLDEMATALGYPYVYTPALTSLDFNLRCAVISKYPYTSTDAIASPEGAYEVARRHPVVVVDVPGTTNDPTIVGMHLKSGTGNDSRFRRAIELRRLREYLQAQAYGSEDNVIVLGDTNLSSSDTVYDALPAGLPAAYTLGADVTFPVTYSTNAEYYFTELPLIELASSRLNGDVATTDWGTRIDLLLVSENIAGRTYGTEIYDSNLDVDNLAGLPKSGVALSSTDSADASDHYAVFADLELDPEASLLLTLDYPSATEASADGTANLTVVLPEAPGTGETVSVSLVSDDVSEAIPVLSTVTFFTGETQKTVAIRTLEDYLLDGNQSISFMASAPHYQSATVAFTVIESDVDYYTFSSSGQTITEGFDNFAGAADPIAWSTTGGTWLGADDGSAKSSSNYAYGASPDPSLGILMSTSDVSAEAEYHNMTGAAITSLEVSVDAEQWRAVLNGPAETIAAELITTAGTVSLPGLSFVAATGLPTGSVSNGNPTTLTSQVSGLSIPHGEAFHLRFNFARAEDRGAQPADVWVNELHYDNNSTDTGEFIEVVVGPGFTAPLSELSLVLYNGNDGATYGSPHLLSSFTLGDTTSSGHRIFFLDRAGIQNGPDGLAIVHNTTVLHFISYEGSFTAVDGPAVGMSSVDVGVSQNAEPVGLSSIGLTGASGEVASDFTWTKFAGAYTKGSLNEGQSFQATSQGLALDNVSVTLLPNDSDGDGLTDEQETLLGTSPTLVDTDGNGTPDPEEDADGDGFDNITELTLLLNDPLDANSHFRLTATYDGTDYLWLEYPVLAGRSYELFTSTNLQAWTSQGSFTAVATEPNYSQAVAISSMAAFYYVRVTFPP